jgi:hypothetical protein
VKYTVVWLPRGEKKLTNMWLRASDRNAISNAVNLIDKLLSVDPMNVGESRDEPDRILHQTPLGVIFRVVDDDRLVMVIDVWRYAR